MDNKFSTDGVQHISRTYYGNRFSKINFFRSEPIHPLQPLIEGDEALTIDIYHEGVEWQHHAGDMISSSQTVSYHKSEGTVHIVHVCTYL